MRAGGRNFSSADGSLKLVATHTHSGCDALGEFEATVLAYEAGGPATPFEAEFRVYGPASVGAGAVVFVQRFPRGAEGTALGGADLVGFASTKLLSSFPSFKLSAVAGAAGRGAAASGPAAGPQAYVQFAGIGVPSFGG